MADEKRTAKVVKSGDREIVIERIFDAPRERVYAIYTDPELIPRWWGSREDETEVVEMDVRQGGSWHFRCAGAEGTDEFRGVYRVVDPPERLEQTFEWLGMPGHVSVETAVFEDLGEQTKVTTTSIFHRSEERDGMFDSMGSGAMELYDRLDELLAEG